MPDTPATPESLLGVSRPMAAVKRFLGRAAAVDVPVLLVGETGTGKSHLARLIHRGSRRRRGALVAVNCAAIPEPLFESELFGHRRGAFTGATESRTGLFEAASGGTLLLDEVGELPPSQQAKLLTALEERTVRPVGESRPRPVDVRVVSATCRDLAATVRAGQFRTDLFHRIALLRLEIPPLRRRLEDIEPLCEHFLRGLASKYELSRIRLGSGVCAALRAHPWPGNVRELAHALEAALILGGSDRIDVEVLAGVLARSAVVDPEVRGGGALAADPGEVYPASGGPPGRASRYSFFGTPEEERRRVLAALDRCRGNRTRAARELGMSRNTLRTRMRRYGIE